MKNRYNWGIIGPGKIAHQFAKGLSVTEKGVLFAIGSRDAGRASEFAEEYGAIRSHGSYDELIHDNEVDVIYIATPHHLHYELTKKCLIAGKAVLCEKPATINARQFEDLAALSREKHVFYMDALWSRFFPGIIKTMELIHDGIIGEVKALKADFGFKADYNPEGRLFNPGLGGGSILDIGIYPLFLSLLVLGVPDVIRARAVKGSTGVDESCTMAFSYQSGAIANLMSTFLVHSDTSAEICGTLGRIYIGRKWFRPQSVTLVPDEGESRVFNFELRKNGYEYEAEEVMKCLDTGKTESELLPRTFTHQLMKLLDAVRKEAGITYQEDLVQ